MDTAFAWQQLFENWPTTLPRRGLVVTAAGETIEFREFLTSEGLVAFERERPDSSGARKVVLAFSAITAVKMTDTEPLSGLKSLGFQGPQGA